MKSNRGTSKTLIITFTLIIYLSFLGGFWPMEEKTLMKRSNVLTSDRDKRKAKNVLSKLCDAYNRNEVMVELDDDGKQVVLKSLYPFIDDYQPNREGETEEQLVRRIRDRTEDHLKIGWPIDLSRHLLSILWPSLKSGKSHLNLADRRSLWTLVQQPEYLTFRILRHSRVTPKVIGSCGHMYEVETVIPFKHTRDHINYKGKIFDHLINTLKLFYEFLNDPLQWCDARFEKLGLLTKYPDRFMIMDGDQLFTESKLNSLFSNKTCKSDADCTIGQCTSRCHGDFKCGSRNNDNVDIFCENLLNKLFGNSSNKVLYTCRDALKNSSTKLDDLLWTW